MNTMDPVANDIEGHICVKRFLEQDKDYNFDVVDRMLEREKVGVFPLNFIVFLLWKN